MEEKKLNTARVGQLGELVAADFLIARGYKLLQQNVRYKVGEIDLVMRHPDGYICFVEVKTKTTNLSVDDKFQNAFVGPTEQLHHKKLHKLYKAIQCYLHEHNAVEEQWQLDAVVVLLDQQNDSARCKHLEHISLDV